MTKCGAPAEIQALATNMTVVDAHKGGARFRIELTGRPVQPLDPECGIDGPLTVAVIDEAWCIGCTLCIKACPVDCISGTNKHMHTVIEADCTGCELCLPACPVDCISLEVVTPGRSGWQAWTPEQAGAARQRYQERNARRQRAASQQADRLEHKARHKLEHLADLTRDTEVPGEIDRKRAVIEAAMARARLQRSK